jgi:hypothetical protein
LIGNEINENGKLNQYSKTLTMKTRIKNGFNSFSKARSGHL